MRSSSCLEYCLFSCTLGNLEKQKRERIFVGCFVYGRLLKTRTITAPTTATAMMIATAAYITYVSVMLGGCSTGGGGASGASITVKAVFA